VGAALSLNLFNGLGDRAGLAAASADERRSQAEKAGTEDAVLLDVRSAYFDLEAAVERVGVASEAVVQARESHRITESRYEAGLTNVTELLRSQNAVLDAEARHLGALFEQRVAAARLELAAGSLNSESEALAP
jgi:outer membrane protein